MFRDIFNMYDKDGNNTIGIKIIFRQFTSCTIFKIEYFHFQNSITLVAVIVEKGVDS